MSITQFHYYCCCFCYYCQIHRAPYILKSGPDETHALKNGKKDSSLKQTFFIISKIQVNRQTVKNQQYAAASYSTGDVPVNIYLPPPRVQHDALGLLKARADERAAAGAVEPRHLDALRARVREVHVLARPVDREPWGKIRKERLIKFK